MSEPAEVLHPIAIVQVMVNFGARQGVDPESCLIGTGIQASRLSDPDALVTRDQEMRLLENLILALPQVHALGFELGLQYNVATFGIWGFALRISRSLHEAIERALRYLPLSTAYCRFRIDASGNEFAICADADAIPPHLRQCLLERDIATALNIVRELSLSGVRIQRLEFKGAEPAHGAQITALCGLVPHYRSARNAIVLLKEDFERPLPTYDAHLVRLFEEQCRAQLERRQVSGLAGQVRQLLLGPLGLVATIEDVAPQLAMAPRSLRRKLEDEGTSFRTIIESERKQLAVGLLESTDMKLDEMALQLGYGDTASFTRAFRRWFGNSPGEYRKTSRR